MASKSGDSNGESREHKRTEERIRHLNVLLRAIRNVSQLIAREEDRDRLLQGACEYLTEGGAYHSVWVAFLDESHRLVSVAAAGLDKDFRPLMDRVKRQEWSH